MFFIIFSIIVVLSVFVAIMITTAIIISSIVVGLVVVFISLIVGRRYQLPGFLTDAIAALFSLRIRVQISVGVIVGPEAGPD